jgi:hypothetical protein
MPQKAMAKTTIEFSDSAISQLEHIAETLQTSKADVLRNALSLYAYIVGQVHEQPGRILGIVNESRDNHIDKLIAVPGIQANRLSRSGRDANGE